MLHDEKWDLDEVGKATWAIADYIEEHGWVQGHYGDIYGNGPVCIMGAMQALYKTEMHPSCQKIRKVIGGNRNIVDYNDTVGRTKEEVITMLKQAAKTRE